MRKRAQPAEHIEFHATGRGQLFRNFILGSQDGIVNVLGIVLGVATATSSISIILLAGLAATFAESISMAAVAYTSTRAEAEHYQSEVKREKSEMKNLPERERQEIVDIYRAKGFSGKLLDQIVEHVCSDKKLWLDTMMSEELHLENPEGTMSSFRQGILVGFSALIGSFIPLLPFFFLNVSQSFFLSLGASLLALFLIGAYKSNLTSGKWLSGGIELMLIGGTAGLAGFIVGLLFKV